MLKELIKAILQKCTCVRYAAFLLLVLGVLSGFNVKAQDIDHSFYAKYTYHFTKYVSWPANKKSGDFVVAIVGTTQTSKYLKETFAGKKVGNQNIVVKEMSASDDFSGVSIIFVAASSANQISTLQPKAASAKALLVSEKGGMAKKGADISFFIQDEKLKFELNKNSIENKGLKIATELLRLAVVI